MPTNFLQWNPTSANQESDAAYLADTQRVGGAPTDTPFPSPTANKLFYQATTGITALMQMMSAKGFTVNDTNIGTLAATLAAIQTTADSRAGHIIIPYASTITFNSAKNTGFEVSLTGNITVNITGQTPGQLIFMMFSQDATGGRTISIPSAVGEVFYDSLATAQSTMLFEVVSDGSLRAVTPGMAGSGINGTPIGASIPSTGKFSTLSTTDLATLASLLVSGASTINGGTLNGTFAGSPSFSGNPTFAGAVLNGEYAGNPDFSGAPTVPSIALTDISAKIANTNWVNNFVASIFGSSSGFAINLSINGFIRFPTILGSIIIQWGRTGNLGGNPGTVTFPLVFPNLVFSCVVTPLSGGSNADFMGLYSLSNSGFTVYDDGAGAECVWIAIGY
jgi:hypothetical protein